MITIPPLLQDEDAQTRNDWLRSVMLMCLSKERVTGLWLSDWQSEVPGAGLLDSNGQPDSSLQLLQKLNREFLW
jgi:hypothetical protein